MVRKTIAVILILSLAFGLFPTGISVAAGDQPNPTPDELNPGLDQPDATYRVYLPAVKRSNELQAPSIFGIEIHDLNPANLDLASEVGLSWTRRNGVFWSAVEPQKGQRKWDILSDMEAELKLAAENNLRVILIVRDTPSWAQKNPGSACGPIKESELDAFADFMYNLVIRYSAPPFSVKYWELGNEPDAPINNHDFPFGCWGEISETHFGGQYYAEMLKRVYPRIKAADPDAKVLIGGLLLDCDPDNPPDDPSSSTGKKNCSISRFLEGILLNGGGSYFDGVSFHAYDYYFGDMGQYLNPNWHTTMATGPSVNAKADFIKKTLAAYNASGKMLLSTETALLCGGNCGEKYELTKADHVVHMYTTTKVNGLEAAVWYDWNGNWRSSGLLEANNAPKPGFLAFKFTRQKLGQATFVRQVESSAITGYEFRYGSRRTWVIWSTDGSLQAYNLANPPSAIFNAMGKPLPVSQNLSVDSPIFIDW